MKTAEKLILALTALEQCQEWFESMKTTFEIQVKTEHGDICDIALSSVIEFIKRDGENIDFSAMNP